MDWLNVQFYDSKTPRRNFKYRDNTQERVLKS